MTERKTPPEFAGDWRITEMELWGADHLDLVVPKFIDLNEEMMGQFQFGTVRGWLDCRYTERGDMPAVEFSWEGETDTDDGCGRGWGVLREGRFEGRLFIHRGDDSQFLASRATRPPQPKRKSGGRPRARRVARRRP